MNLIQLNASSISKFNDCNFIDYNVLKQCIDNYNIGLFFTVDVNYNAVGYNEKYALSL